jgi:hypothetical protein
MEDIYTNGLVPVPTPAAGGDDLRTFDLLGQIKSVIDADTTIQGYFAKNAVRSYYSRLPQTKGPRGSGPAIVVDVLNYQGYRELQGEAGAVDFKVDIWTWGGSNAHADCRKVADEVLRLLHEYSADWTGATSGQKLTIAATNPDSYSPIGDPDDVQLYGLRLNFSAHFS